MRATTDDGVRILCVDADPASIERIETSLESADDRFRVETAPTTAEGLTRFDGDPPDCVVSAYDLPDADGLAFLRAVRDQHASLPFILFTDAGSEAVASEAISAGVTDYFHTRGDEQYDQLTARIRDAVDSHRANSTRTRRLEAIEAAQEGISILDADGRFRYVNEAYANLYQYDPAELIGRHWQTLYPDDEVEAVEATILPAVESTGSWHGTTTGVRADGETFTEDHRVAATERGELVCTVRNAGDHTAHQQALARTNTVLRTVVDALPMGVLVENTDRDVLVVNDQLGETLGVPLASDELIGRDCASMAEQSKDLFADPAGFIEGVHERIDSREPVRNEELSLGDGRVLERDYVPYTLPRGEANMWLYRDVTERRRRERELQTTVEAMEASMDGIAILDDDEYVYMNEAHAEVFNFTASELLGSTWRRLYGDDEIERIETEVFPELAQKGAWRGETVGQTREGTPVLQAITLSLVEEDTLICTNRDITAEKRRQRELEKQNDRLSEFASVVSHDLKNPLTVVKGNVSLIDEYHGDELRADIDSLVTAVERMERIVEDTLTLARHGDTVGEMSTVPVPGLAATCWDGVQTSSATLTVDDAFVVHGDRERLRHVFENLFHNAVRHGGTDVTVRVGRAGDERFYVEDDGKGISEDDRDAVFEVGHTSAESGTGFGLTIVKRIAEAHGWEVCVADGRDGGARFEFAGVELEAS